MEYPGNQHDAEEEEMVSVEEKSSYLASLRASPEPETRTFVAWLLDQPIKKPEREGCSDASEVSYASMYAIQSGREESFASAYEVISRRIPSEDTPYIYDEILIFSLVCGVVAFNGDDSWLRRVCSIRLRTSDSEVQQLTQTYFNILSRQAVSSTGMGEVAIVLSHLLGESLEADEDVNATYMRLSSCPFPFYRSHFLNAIALRAADIIVLAKGLDPEHRRTTRQIASMRRTVHRVAFSCWLIMTVTVGVATGLLCLATLNEARPREAEVASLVLSLLGVGGMTGMFVKRRQVQRLLEPAVEASWPFLLILLVSFGAIVLVRAIAFALGLWGN